jgi:hypothetical protein
MLMNSDEMGVCSFSEQARAPDFEIAGRQGLSAITTAVRCQAVEAHPSASQVEKPSTFSVRGPLLTKLHSPIDCIDGR